MTKPSDKPKRPSLDDPGLVDELCARISEGRGIWEIGDNDDDMPAARTIYRHMATDEAFSTRIARARAAQQDALSDQMRQKAATATAENWQAIRLQIWTDQWCAARLAPRRYGATTKHEVGGPDGLPIPLRFASLSDQQLADFIERLERRVEAHGDAPDDPGGAAD